MKISDSIQIDPIHPAGSWLKPIVLLAGLAVAIPLAVCAAGNDAETMFQQGRAAFSGSDGEKDYSKARELLEEAGKHGHAEAMAGLGYLYHEGLGVDKDLDKAADWFRQSAEAGSLKGQLNYGLLLRKGSGVEKSHEKGILWIRKAAEGGLPEGQHALGQLLFLGDDDQAPDRKEALKWLTPLAEQGNPDAQNMVGVATRDGLGGLTPDKDAAKEWFRKAAIQGDRKAQSNLGHILGEPVSENPDREEALKWLIVASENGEITAKKTRNELRPAINSLLYFKAEQEAKSEITKQRLRDANKK